MDDNNSKAINMFENIKSKFILKHIFKYPNKKTLLKIIQYNKILQNKLQISIEDYKKLLQIEIELEMLPQKTYEFDNDFINLKEKNQDYFHIYLNHSKDETKNKYCFEREEKVQPIKIVIDCEQNSLNALYKKNKIC